MSMYDELAAKYDMMIRWKTRLERETPFFQRLFTEKRVQRVLDLACGTGHHARLFHKWGCDVIGVDPSPALLRLAREGLEEEDDSLRFIEADYLTFPEVVEGPFDVVLSLGNSLPHLQ
ncbi:MAG TPA: class I SAM-dependent methyltransferase, partial [Bacteroidetes bacterium]|nr:class I SAM-dependent methyltransferase [Bacteroidota bacterium]